MRATNLTKYAALLTLGGLILCLSGVAVAYSTMGTSALGVYRMLLGGLGLATFAWAKGMRFQVSQKAFVYACFAGVALALDLYCWHKSIRLIGPGLSTILNNCQSFFMAFMAYVVFKEKITPIYLVCLLCAAMGVVMICAGGEGTPASADGKMPFLLGAVLALVSAMAYALCLVCIKVPQSVSRDTPQPVISMIVLCATAGMALLLTAFLEGESLVIPDTKNLVTVLLYGLVVQGVAWLMVSTAMSHVSASLAGLILLAEPVGTYVLDVLYFSAKPTAGTLAGIALTISAIYIGSVFGATKGHVT